MNDLEKWVLNEMIDELYVLEDKEISTNMLVIKLFGYYDYMGYYPCSCTAKEWIIKYFDCLGTIIDDYINEFGEYPGGNIFRNPEKFQLDVIFFIATRIMYLSAYVASNNIITLTTEVINTIREEWQEALTHE